MLLLILFFSFTSTADACVAFENFSTCHESCDTCVTNSICNDETQCTKCAPDFRYRLRKGENDKFFKCVSKCNTYSRQVTCYEFLCDDPYEIETFVVAPKTFDDFKRCSGYCEECNDADNPESCTSCLPGSFKVSRIFHAPEFGCIPYCPPNMIIHFRQEPFCDIFLSGDKCHSSCKTCSKVLLPTKCTSCHDDWFKVANNIDDPNFQCIKTCPATSVPLEGQNFGFCYLYEKTQVVSCAPNCRTCARPNDRLACTRCHDGWYMITNRRRSNRYFDCVESCPVRAMAIENEAFEFCPANNQSCLECSVSTDSEECQKCHRMFKWLKKSV